jgi:hypothetical protein
MPAAGGCLDGPDVPSERMADVLQAKPTGLCWLIGEVTALLEQS